PNCMGLLNTAAAVKLNASFSPIVPPAGRVAFSSQSGALGMAILRLAMDRRVGLSSFVSVGHTAALAASDIAVDALFHQAGVIRADTIDEMFDIATCLEAQPLPPGRRVAIVTNAGGPGILAVDACEAAGLTVAPFTDSTRARLSAFLPPEASLGNPIDTIASAGPDAY